MCWGRLGLMAESGVRLAPESEERVATAIPLLSAALEDGPLLWLRFCRVLLGRYAGGRAAVDACAGLA